MSSTGSPTRVDLRALIAAVYAAAAAAGVWARRRLGGRDMGGRQRPAVRSAAPNAVRDGESNAAIVGVRRRAGARSAIGA